jgi:hypothetical protein
VAPKKKPAPPESAKIQFRFPTELIDALDAWTAKLNEGRSWPLLTRSDVVRDALLWAARERPDIHAPPSKAK